MKALIQKHYEKLILGVVLLAVAATSFWLSIKAGDVAKDLAEKLQTKTSRNQKPLKPVTLDASAEALARLGAASAYKLDGEHNTFNPLTWVYDKDHILHSVIDNGSGGLSFEKAIPLNLTVEFAGVAGTGDPYRYQFTITKDYEKKPADRHPKTTSLSEGQKNELFSLKEVKGPKDAPTELVLEMLDGGEKFSVSAGKPYVTPLGWAADIKSLLDNHVFAAKRASESFTHRNSQYKIVAIQKDELVVSAANGLRRTLKVNAVP
jgi:hypothetical protein